MNLATVLDSTSFLQCFTNFHEIFVKILIEENRRNFTGKWDENLLLGWVWVIKALEIKVDGYSEFH